VITLNESEVIKVIDIIHMILDGKTVKEVFDKHVAVKYRNADLGVNENEPLIKTQI
jgi:hypothetical protein